MRLDHPSLLFIRVMPRRRDKRTDTENSDEYEERPEMEKVTHFGSVQFNRLLAPDRIEGDDATKYEIRAWSNTLNAQRLLQWPERKELFERALGYLPYSYKIWHMYLTEYMEYCMDRSLFSRDYANLNETFERALSKLPKMPRIWLMYCECLSRQNLVTKTRAVFNWSFRNLPLTQHEKIWKKFTKWCMKLDNISTALAAIPRYLKLNPDFKEEYVDYLYQKEQYHLCVKVLLDILADDGYSSKARLSKQDFHMQLVDILTDYPDKCQVDGGKLIRDAIEKYEEERGKLWVKLSDYYIRLGDFDKARDVFEEALESIDNVKNFSVIFSSYCKFEEEMITALADEGIRREAEVVKEDYVDEEIERRLQKLESLIQRRPYLLHRINLRKNPNNVKEWIRLSRLYFKDNKEDESMQTLQEALEAIDPNEAVEGKLSEVVIEIAGIHHLRGNIVEVNRTMLMGTQIMYKFIDDYYSIWSQWAEMMLEEGYYQDALRIVKHVLFRKKARAESPEEEKMRSNEELLKSHTGMWQLYIDLEISIGNFETTKLAYERCKDHKCLTPIMLFNFTSFLWENAYFEEAFRTFEFAVNNFTWPSLFDIWVSYLTKFISRYSQDGIGVERTRSMFEKLLKEVPKDKCSIFYFMYAEFEENYGLYSHAIQIYDRMIKAVPQAERYQAFNIYIAKVSKLLGITKTRAIFDEALQKLDEKEVLEIGRKYADIEIKMGEIERARAIYVYISQFTNPRDDRRGVWEEWQSFEAEYGDKETFKQHLRIKRTIDAKYVMLPPDLEKIEEEVKKGLA